jgi:hypothetical protein
VILFINIPKKGTDLEQNLLKIYKNNFKYTSNINIYLEVINTEINNTFSPKEINFFIKCNDENVDLIALEYLLRKKNKSNIFSFLFLRLSSLAETVPENQDKYVNKSKLNLFKVFILLSTTVIKTVLLELKRISLSNKIKEYSNV